MIDRHKKITTMTESERDKQSVDQYQVWNKFEGQNSPNVFNDVTIARDGGFSEVHELWYPMRWVTAIVTVLFLLSNLYYTLGVDIAAIMQKHDGQEAYQFLISGACIVRVINFIRGTVGYENIHFYGDQMVALIELVLTLSIILFTCYRGVQAWGAKRAYDRWCACEEVWWSLIPDLYTYSAMRLLHYVSPQVFVADLSEVCNRREKVFFFIIARLSCFFLGFDAFLLKCHEYRSSISDDEGFSLTDLWNGLLFMKQVLGIVQLGMFVRSRLFTFIFAGEDAIMQHDEVCLKNVWNAMLVRKIFQTFSTSKAVVVMLSFDDADFQKLVLNERAKLTLIQESCSCSDDGSDSSP